MGSARAEQGRKECARVGTSRAAHKGARAQECARERVCATGAEGRERSAQVLRARCAQCSVRASAAGAGRSAHARSTRLQASLRARPCVALSEALRARRSSLCAPPPTPRARLARRLHGGSVVRIRLAQCGGRHCGGRTEIHSTDGLMDHLRLIAADAKTNPQAKTAAIEALTTIESPVSATSYTMLQQRTPYAVATTCCNIVHNVLLQHRTPCQRSTDDSGRNREPQFVYFCLRVSGAESGFPTSALEIGQRATAAWGAAVHAAACRAARPRASRLTYRACCGCSGRVRAARR